VKLRIRGNSIRLRLTRSEVDQLCAVGRVSEAVHLPSKRSFGYALEVSDRVDRPTAEWDGDGIRVLLPRPAGVSWARSEQVGIEAQVALDDGGALTLLVEKDFPCLVPRPGENDADAFARPADTSEQCRNR